MELSFLLFDLFFSMTVLPFYNSKKINHKFYRFYKFDNFLRFLYHFIIQKKLILNFTDFTIIIS